MLRLLLRAIAPVFVLLILVVPIAAFPLALRHIRAGRWGRLSGIVRFAGLTLAPTVIFVLLCLLLIGLEELFGAALVPEELGRSMLLVVALGLLVGILAQVIFAVALLVGRR
jgi:hypothetical protein